MPPKVATDRENIFPLKPEGVKEFVSPCRSSLFSDSSPLGQGGT